MNSTLLPMLPWLNLFPTAPLDMAKKRPTTPPFNRRAVWFPSLGLNVQPLSRARQFPHQLCSPHRAISVAGNTPSIFSWIPDLAHSPSTCWLHIHIKPSTLILSGLTIRLYPSRLSCILMKSVNPVRASDSRYSCYHLVCW